MIYDNPAARLKAILDAGLKENKDQSCITVWRKLLEANPNDAGDLFHRLGKTMELPQKNYNFCCKHTLPTTLRHPLTGVTRSIAPS